MRIWIISYLVYILILHLSRDNWLGQNRRIKLPVVSKGSQVPLELFDQSSESILVEVVLEVAAVIKLLLYGRQCGISWY